MSQLRRSPQLAHHANPRRQASASAASPRLMTGYVTSRPAILSMAKLFVLGLVNLPFLDASPLGLRQLTSISKVDGKPPSDPSLWIYLATAVVLVLLGGAFAGLTIALMGQDDVNLQVIQASGEGTEKKHAGSVLRLLKRGKHWVLVTLLLGNVITNETLPIVLDRSLGGGWPAVLSSTVLIVIFGEIIPQSICVRFGLPIGAWMSPLVLVLMYILGPVAWPTAKLLDWLLGEEHGNVYKKAGLKTLVDLHKTLGTSPHERLNQDEVTIISAVLDLKDKPVGSIMTPIDDVFTIPSDTVLDEKTMDIILSAGYSRIPIYAPDNEKNFVGMLLVKILITYDPEDGKRVSEFALATLPETRPETSCLDIVNFFQEGKSHMVLVSDFPGEDEGALGVVTLEDVIEELIGEEIIDESDVFVDVHKAIRRMTPAPKARVPKGHVVDSVDAADVVEPGDLIEIGEDEEDQGPFSRQTSVDGTADINAKSKASMIEHGTSPRRTFQMRRQSSNAPTTNGGTSVTVRGTAPEMRDQLKHLGPSNLASRPRTTRYNTVKIKPGGGSMSDEAPKNHPSKTSDGASQGESLSSAPHGGVGAGILSSAGKDAKDGVLALKSGYGSLTSPPRTPHVTRTKGVQADEGSHDDDGKTLSPTQSRRPKGDSRRPSQDMLESFPRKDLSRSPHPQKGTARSGSITENVINAGGVRKVILETTSSSEEGDEGGIHHGEGAKPDDGRDQDPAGRNGEPASDVGGKKKRRRKRKNKGATGEETPLLER